MGNPFSSFTEKVEDFVRPVTDPIRSGLAKIVPKEAKPYLEVYLNSLLGAAPGVGPLNFATNLLGGTLRQAAIQKLFTDPEDEDTDVDYLTAFGSGLQTAFQGLQPDDRLVDLEKEGVTDRFAGLDNPDTTTTITNRDLLTQTQLPEGATLQLSPAELAALDQPALRYTSATNPEMAARLNLGLTERGFDTPGAAFDAARLNAEPSTLNFLKSDVAQAFKDFATPTNPFKEGSFMGGVGEISSQIGATQAVLAPSQVRDAAKALEAAEREYENYLATLDAENRARIEDDINARIDAHKKYMRLAGFTDAEIDDALVTAGYISSGETVFAAQGGRIGFATGSGTEDDRDEIAFNLFGKPYVELDLDEREELKEEMIRLRNKFMATGGRVGMQPGGLAGLAKMLMSIMRKGDEKQIKGVIRDPKTDLERLKDTDPKQPTIRDMEDLPGKLGYDKRNTRKLEELVEREKVRAILADRMGVDPKEISEVDIDMAIREGMGMFSKGGGVGSLFRRK